MAEIVNGTPTSRRLARIGELLAQLAELAAPDAAPIIEQARVEVDAAAEQLDRELRHARSRGYHLGGHAGRRRG